MNAPGAHYCHLAGLGRHTEESVRTTAWPRVISTANGPPCPLAACSGIALLASSVATLANLDRRTRIARSNAGCCADAPHARL